MHESLEKHGSHGWESQKSTELQVWWSLKNAESQDKVVMENTCKK